MAASRQWMLLTFFFVVDSLGLASITGPLIAAALYRKDLEAQKTGYGSHGFAPIVLFVGRLVES